MRRQQIVIAPVFFGKSGQSGEKEPARGQRLRKARALRSCAPAPGAAAACGWPALVPPPRTVVKTTPATEVCTPIDYAHLCRLDRRGDDLLLDLDEFLGGYLRGHIHTQVSFRVLLRRLHLAELLLVLIEHDALVGNRLPGSRSPRGKPIVISCRRIPG